MFCKNCAEVLTDTDVTCPKCGFAAGTGVKYCATCGEEMPVGALVCEMCGTKVEPAPGGFAGQTAYAQQPQPQFQQAYQQPYAQQPYPNQQAYPNQQPYGSQPVNPAFQQQAYQPYQGVGRPMTMYNAGEQKSKVAAGLLGIFLGAFGVHNFYLGYTSKAVIQLLMTLMSCGALGIVSEIWGLIEGIQILTGSISTDAKGIPLKD